MVLILCPALASSQDVTVRGLTTNFGLMEKVSTVVVDSLIRTMPLPLLGPVYIRPSATHDANWMIENVFAGRLKEKGVRVVVSIVSPAPVSPETSEADTAASRSEAQGSVFKMREIPETETEAQSLEYRINELNLEYSKVWRPHLVGRKSVERVAVASLSARLVEESSGRLSWVGEGSATRKDVVPASQLPFLEGKNATWQKGTLPKGKGGALIEPLIVAAIVAGLVYLFYSNKE